MSSLQSSRVEKLYPCSQQDLYSIVETGWNSYAEYLPEFEALSTNYSAATGTDQLGALRDARMLPDEDSRDEVHKSLRIELAQLASECLIRWSNLSTYIRDGFPAEQYDNKRIAAGLNYYESAANDNWDDVKGLMQNGVLFIANNAAVLTSGGMPLTYQADFEADKDAFELKHQEFIQALEEAKVVRDKKIEANNALQAALANMFEDGKRIFRNNAAVREQFTYDRVWALVKGNNVGSDGLAATELELLALVYDANTTAPIEGAELTVLNTPAGVSVTGTTNAQGIVEILITGYEPQEEVVLDWSFSAVGYTSEMGSIDVKAGGTYSIEIGLVEEG